MRRSFQRALRFYFFSKVPLKKPLFDRSTNVLTEAAIQGFSNRKVKLLLRSLFSVYYYLKMWPNHPTEIVSFNSGRRLLTIRFTLSTCIVFIQARPLHQKKWHVLSSNIWSLNLGELSQTLSVDQKRVRFQTRFPLGHIYSNTNKI